MTPAAADKFHFRDGRVVSGKVLQTQTGEVGGTPVTMYTVEVAPNTFVKIMSNELVRTDGYEVLSEVEQEYVQRAQQLDETADGHYQLAVWCEMQGLTKLARAHYSRVIDLDPDNASARDRVGYKRDRGRWVKKEVVMGGERGKVLYKGRWRFPASVAIEQAEEAEKKAIAEVTGPIYRWHNDILSGQPRRASQAYEKLQTVNSPLAISQLADFLLDVKSSPTARPTPPDLKLLYIRLLSQFEVYAAVAALSKASIVDENDSIRAAALETLTQGERRQVAITVFMGYLTSTDNRYINRAADNLGYLRADFAVLPLIQALVSQHVEQVGGGNTTYSTGGMSFGGKAQKVKVPYQNQSVRSTLNQLTGEDFEYNQAAWLTWYANRYSPPVDDLMRDP